MALGTAGLDTGGGYNFGAGMAFVLSNTVNSTELQALYDRYKINGVKVKIVPLSNTATIGSTQLIPTVMYSVETDDIAIPTALELQQKFNMKERRLDKPISIYVRPKPADLIYNTAASNIGNAVPGSRNQYINMTYPDARHYGLKLFFRNVNLNTTASTATAFRIETTYFISCRDPQ